MKIENYSHDSNFGALLFQPVHGSQSQENSQGAAHDDGSQLGGVGVTAVPVDQVHAVRDGAARRRPALVRLRLTELTFVARVTQAKKGVKGPGPVRDAATTRQGAWLTVTVGTGVHQDVDVQGQLQTVGARFVPDPGVVGCGAAVASWDEEHDLLAADTRGAGQVDVR